MWSDLRIRLRALFRRGRTEAELADELRFHLEQSVRVKVEGGIPEAEARREARLELGGLETIKEECRDARGLALVEEAVRDFRLAARRLARDWRFTVGALVILTLGIGANTAIFSVVNAVLFREPPYLHPDRLVNLYQNVSLFAQPTTAKPEASSYPAYRDMAAFTDLFSAVGATSMPLGVRFQDRTGVRPAVAEFAASTWLEVLGLRPSRGRWFRAEEDEAGAEAVAVVSHRSWRTRFGADPDMLGRTIRVNGVPVTVIGIGPVGFHCSLAGGGVTDLWMSVSSLPSVLGRPGALGRRGGFFLVKGRLREGVGIEQVRVAMDVLGRRLAAEYPGDDPGKGITVLAEDEVRVHPMIDEALAPGAAVLLVTVGLVLAIACSNLATLSIVRGTARARELSLRMSLGARRSQVVRHLLAESLLLSALGGAGGCLLALALLRSLSRVELPILVDWSLDLRVLAFALVLSMITGVGVGLAPALKATRVDLLPALREEGETLSLERRWFTLKNGLVAVQVVVSFVLLVGTSFSLRMLVQGRAREMGFAVGGVALLETDARYAGYSSDRSRAVVDELRQRVAALPGVESAALGRGTPMRIGGYLPLDDGGDADHAPRLPFLWAGPGTFETFGIPLLHGRGFDHRDRLDTPAVAVVNESFARTWFGTVDAVGRRLRVAPSSANLDAPTENQPDSLEVIGVVPDTLTADLDQELQPLFFRSLTQSEHVPTTVVARSSRDAASLLAAMERELLAIDPALPAITAKTMERQIEDSLTAHEVVTAFLSALALLGLTLASVGLYAVVSFAVAQRAREVAIRTALGGRTGQVTWAISRGVAKLLFVAVGAASLVSLVAVRVLSSLDLSRPADGVHLNVPTIDAGTLPFVAAILLAAGLVATWLPARRAAKADPLSALRHE